jgi:hypothetical protein
MTAIPPLIGQETRDCPQVLVPGANDGSLMEIDVFGKPAPTCRSATRRLRLAVEQLPEETWGNTGAWRCIWGVSVAYCGKAKVRIYAANPGD